MCTCTHMHLCAALWAHVEICMSGVFSTALHLRSFPLKRKLCTGLQAQLAWGDTVAEVSGGRQSQEDRAVGPSSEQLQVQSVKSLPYTGGEHTLPSLGLPGGHLKCVTHGWNYSCLLLLLSSKNLAMPESEFHFREGEEFRKWQEPGTRSVDSNTPDFVWVSIPLLRW